jgi:peptidoglycan/LPS O-acetylase OafA/YrhL
VLWGLVGLGAAGILFCAIGATSVRRMLNRRVPQFLGRNSFSLYLVHVPILATLAYALGDAQWWLVGLIGVPLSIGFAVVFRRFIELPSHRLAQAIGKRAARPRKVTRSAGTDTTRPELTASAAESEPLSDAEASAAGARALLVLR